MVYIGGVGIGIVYSKVKTYCISQNRRGRKGIEELSGAAARTGSFKKKKEENNIKKKCNASKEEAILKKPGVEHVNL